MHKILKSRQTHLAGWKVPDELTRPRRAFPGLCLQGSACQSPQSFTGVVPRRRSSYKTVHKNEIKARSQPFTRLEAHNIDCALAWSSYMEFNRKIGRGQGALIRCTAQQQAPPRSEDKKASMEVVRLDHSASSKVLLIPANTIA